MKTSASYKEARINGLLETLGLCNKSLGELNDEMNLFWFIKELFQGFPRTRAFRKVCRIYDIAVSQIDPALEEELYGSI